MSVERSDALILVGYFLARCGKKGAPSELGVESWNQAYATFYDTLSDGRSYSSFVSTLKLTRDQYDSHVDSSRRGFLDERGAPRHLPERDRHILETWHSKSDAELWDQVARYAHPNTSPIDASVVKDVAGLMQPGEAEVLLGQEGKRTRWQRAVLDGIRRYCSRHQTRLIKRRQLIDEELPAIAKDAAASGRTPSQTLSRVLQELRRAGILSHVRRGIDLLLDGPLPVEAEDLPDAALDAAIEHDQLRISDVATSDDQIVTRRRRGQARLRQHTLTNYEGRCALCDVRDPELLVTSHIVRWSDNQAAQGRLSNVLCLCRMHDALFENGYIALADDLHVLRPRRASSAIVEYLQSTADRLRSPKSHLPAPEYLRQHRQRIGCEVGELKGPAC